MQQIGKLKLDLQQYAEMIEFAAGPALPGYQQGLYLPGSDTPVVVPNTRYFIYNNTDGFIPTEDLGGKHAAVFDEKGVLVLVPAQKPYLRPTPYLPYRGIQVIEVMVKHMLQDYGSWESRSRGDLYEMLHSYFVPGYFSIQLVEQLEAHVEDVLREVHKFLGPKHHWIIAYHKLEGSTLTVEKAYDYRFYNYQEVENQLRVMYGDIHNTITEANPSDFVRVEKLRAAHEKMGRIMREFEDVVGILKDL